MSVSTLVATVGASDANAYCTLAVANQFHSDRPAAGTTWADATNDEKIQAILWATKLLDAMVDWTGYVVDGDQALLWPRSGMVYRSGYSVEIDDIPLELQQATAEYARQLLADDRSADSDIETMGLKSLTAGPVSMVFDEKTPAKPVPDAVVYLLPREWYRGIRGRSSGVRTLMRV